MESEKKKFRFSIRKKLLLLSLAVISVPVVGYEYLKELESYFRNSLEMSVSDSAKAIAGSLHENYRLFPYTDSDSSYSLFIHSLKYPIQVDGYDDDWSSYLDWSNDYLLDDKTIAEDQTLSYKLILGQRDFYLYIFIQVFDDKVIFQHPNQQKILNGDYVEIVIADDYQVKQKYYFLTSAPGKFSPFEIEKIVTDWEEHEYTRDITNIIANWQPTNSGYNIEIALPLWMLDTRIGIIVNDADNMNNQEYLTLGTAGVNTNEKPGKLLQPSREIEQILQHLEITSGRRVWVLDELGQVLATTGSLNRKVEENPFNLFYSFILPSVADRFVDDLAGASSLNGREIQTAFQGRTSARWRSTPDNKAVIVSAATPVWLNRQVKGVVVVEETTNNIQMLQRHALVSLFNKTILIFLIITILILLYAGRLSFRLRRLTNEADAAIDQHGRVIGKISSSSINDEIGELSRNYAAMLDRLKQYNDYLESLAGKLSHELRTPMAVVQTSLENMQTGISENDINYLDRAREGINRLNTLLVRLSEAANLDQALQTAEFRSVDICSLLKNCISGYQIAYPDHEFILETPADECYRNISDDLFIQMLDKLIANAVDFSYESQPVLIMAKKSGQGIIIEIINYGPPLKKEISTQMFESLVSVREKKNNEVHLGLGLFIARKIVELHGGFLRAKNISGDRGVKIEVLLPEQAGREK